ncbi:MAG: hypothetical protein AAGI48_04350 [Verrucomicrobiota bacterium]
MTVFEDRIPDPPAGLIIEGSVGYSDGIYTTGGNFRTIFGPSPSGIPLARTTNTFHLGYFEFDATALPETILSGSLELFLPFNGLAGSAPTSTQTFDLRSSTFDRIASPGTYNDEDVPNFAGEETLARVTITAADAGTTIAFEMNAAGIAYLQSAVDEGDSLVKLSTLVVDVDWPNTAIFTNEINRVGFVFANTAGLPAMQQPRLVVNSLPDPATFGVAIQMTQTGPEVTFTPAAGFNHRVQYSTTLAPGSWNDLPGAPHNSGSVVDTNTGTDSGRFYQVVVELPGQHNS